jgi:hypothetical protein
VQDCKHRSNDAMILSYDATPSRMEFSERTRRRDLKPSHSTRTKRKAIANIQQYVLIRWRSKIQWMEFSEPTGKADIALDCPYVRS